METQAFKMTSLAKENFPQRNISNTVKVRVPDVDRRKCDLKTIWGVVISPKICTKYERKMVY